MNEITMHRARQATVGMVTLCSARKAGCTMFYHFWIKVGISAWNLFDIRKIPAGGRTFAANRPSENQDFERFLSGELLRAARYCNDVGYKGP